MGVRGAPEPAARAVVVNAASGVSGVLVRPRVLVKGYLAVYEGVVEASAVESQWIASAGPAADIRDLHHCGGLTLCAHRLGLAGTDLERGGNSLHGV